MNAISTGLWSTLRASALLLSAVVSAPCMAGDEADSNMDSAAYQLIQLLNQNEALSSEISGLRGQIEELLEGADRSRESQRKIATDFDARIRKIETKPEVDTTEDKAKIAELENRLQQLEEALAAMHEVVTSATQAPVAKSASETIYESALEKYQAGNYEAAILDLRVFLQLYGDDPASPGARYWLAEALLRQGEYESAIETGEILLDGSPDSEKAPDTMFLLGKAHLEMGDATAARGAWENLVATHPDSSPANKARRLLEQLP